METKRLYLREQSEEDADELLRLYEQKETSVFQETKALSRREVLERIRAYRQYYQFFGYGIWVICLKENDRMIGLAGFSNLEVEGKFCLDLGYVLDSPYRHQGYALEACRGILDFAGRYFDDREEGEIIPVICQIKPDNQPSIRLAEKLGFQKWKENRGLVIWRMMREEIEKSGRGEIDGYLLESGLPIIPNCI